MKRKCLSPEQISRKLRTADQLLNQDQSVADVCRALEVSAATYHRWQQLYGGMKATEAKCLKELEQRTPGLSDYSLMLNSIKPCSRSLLRREAHLAVPRETSKPGTSPQSCRGSAGSIPGFPGPCLSLNRSESQYPAALHAIGRYCGAEAPQWNPGTGQEPCAPGQAAGLQAATTGWLDGQSQAGAKALAGVRAPAPPAAQAEARSTNRCLQNAAESRVPASRVGD
jgi:putative transposase